MNLRRWVWLKNMPGSLWGLLSLSTSEPAGMTNYERHEAER